MDTICFCKKSQEKNSIMRITFTAFLLLIQTLWCLALDAKVDWHVHPTTGAYYQLNTQSALTWPQAETSCQQQGASLLSITDPHEQAYVTALLGSGGDKLWTGLFLDPGHGWKWSNGRPYRYMKWDSGHPLPDPGHNCAMIAPAVRYNWQSFPCSRKLGYICYSKAREVVPTKAAETGFCSSPWIPYNGHCFYLNHTLKMWPDAQRDCRNRGGDLASIHSVEDQSFVNSQLGFASTDELWIGLNDRKTEKLFDWADHSTVSFTSWEFGKPVVSTDIKDCVLIRGETGNWADRVCEEKHGFICMKLSSTTATGDEVEKYVYKHLEKRAVVTPVPPIPTTPPKCPPQWNKFRKRNYCYKVFSQSPSGRTWHEARDYCKTIGGDLLSIHSDDELILIQLIRNHGRAWIGLSAPDPSTGYVWSDGSPLQFQHWKDDEPNNKNNLESCVQLTFQNFYGRGSWSNVHCDKGLPWLCQIQKGLTPNPPPDPIPAAYNRTSDGWLEWNGNQYYIGERRSLAMDDARYFCKKNHGDLVTINSEAESVFLWKQIKSLSRSFWIGLTVDLDRTYGWMDGSPVVFLRWDEGQPRFEYNDENCALMTYSMGLWHNRNCGLEHGFICKRNGTPPAHATVPPSVPPKGGCPLKWKKMNSMCYIINEQRKTWEEARTQCKSMGANLASINSRHVQVFLTTSMAEAPNTDLWIGLHGKDQYQSYWTDGRPKRYDDWNFKQQTSHFGHQGHQPRFCVVMTSDTEQLGKWTLKSCNDTNGYICLRSVDPSLPDSPEPTTTNYVHIFNDSVKVVTTKMSWYAAQKHCKEDGATLASLRNIWSKKYVDLVTLNLNAPVWIGINSVETGGYFRYTEGWDLTSTYWRSGEPKRDRPCVYVDVDGEWRTSDCDTTIASVCMKSTDVPPTEPPDFPGICPDVPEQPQSRRQLHSWLPFKGNCYLFLVERHSWPDASVNCAKNGGSLVSIEEPSEHDFIHSKVKGYKDTYMHSGMFFWMGLYKTYRGQWLWFDKAAMNYTNWNSGEPYAGSYGAMRVNDGRWISTRTTYGSGYICKTPKVLLQAPTTVTSPVVNPGDQTH